MLSIVSACFATCKTYTTTPGLETCAGQHKWPQTGQRVILQNMHCQIVILTTQVILENTNNNPKTKTVILRTQEFPRVILETTHKHSTAQQLLFFIPRATTLCSLWSLLLLQLATPNLLPDSLSSLSAQLPSLLQGSAFFQSFFFALFQLEEVALCKKVVL